MFGKKNFVTPVIASDKERSPEIMRQPAAVSPSEKPRRTQEQLAQLYSFASRGLSTQGSYAPEGPSASEVIKYAAQVAEFLGSNDVQNYLIA